MRRAIIRRGLHPDEHSMSNWLSGSSSRAVRGLSPTLRDAINACAVYTPPATIVARSRIKKTADRSTYLEPTQFRELLHRRPFCWAGGFMAQSQPSWMLMTTKGRASNAGMPHEPKAIRSKFQEPATWSTSPDRRRFATLIEEAASRAR
jgi:hypothetical protein